MSWSGILPIAYQNCTTFLLRLRIRPYSYFTDLRRGQDISISDATLNQGQCVLEMFTVDGCLSN